MTLEVGWTAEVQSAFICRAVGEGGFELKAMINNEKTAKYLTFVRNSITFLTGEKPCSQSLNAFWARPRRFQKVL